MVICRMMVVLTALLILEDARNDAREGGIFFREVLCSERTLSSMGL